MNKEQMLNKIKKYLSEKYECNIIDLDKKGLNIIKNKEKNKLKMLLFYDLILVSSSTNIYDYVCEKLKDKNTYEIFEFPLVYGQSIYYIPNLNKISKQEETLKYKFKLFDGNTDKIELSSGFENAITFENGKCISNIAYCAYKDNKIIGVAGADKINEDIWEVGIEVLPEYRKDGLATILTQNLTLKILEKGIVPIWCASVSNIGSQAVATNSDYIPIWMETFGDIFEEDYAFKDIINVLIEKF